MINKPLNLDKPVQTRDGRAARIICTNRKTSGTQMPVLALVTTHHLGSVSEYIEFFTEEGTTHRDGSVSKLDLINIPVKRKGWVNVYPWGEKNFTIAEAHKTKTSANRAAVVAKRIACIPIEFEEGEGLDET